MRALTHHPHSVATFGVFALTVGALCWFLGRSAQAETVGLAELAQRESAPLMSCASEEVPSDEPMWCADPDSPHCIPALPKPPQVELSHGPVAVLWPMPERDEPQVPTLLGFPPLQAERAPAKASAQRLERPPRCV